MINPLHKHKTSILRSIYLYWSLGDGSFKQKFKWTIKWLYYRLRIKLGLDVKNYWN